MSCGIANVGARDYVSILWRQGRQRLTLGKLSWFKALARGPKILFTSFTYYREHLMKERCGNQLRSGQYSISCGTFTASMGRLSICGRSQHKLGMLCGLRKFLSIFVPELSRLRGRRHVVEPFRSDLDLQVIDKLRDESD